jgi:hypothetical protein
MHTLIHTHTHTHTHTYPHTHTLTHTQIIDIPRAALQPILVAWPSLAITMARVVMERRLQMGEAEELEADAEVREITDKIDKHYSANGQVIPEPETQT